MSESEDEYSDDDKDMDDPTVTKEKTSSRFAYEDKV